LLEVPLGEAAAGGWIAGERALELVEELRVDRVVVPARERGQRDGPHARLAVARAAEQRQLRARDRRGLEQRRGGEAALERLRALHREHVDREPARERRLEVLAQRLGCEIAQV